MDDTLHATLSSWADFYLITGTAAAALTGLQFVVQTLIASGTSRAVAGADAEASIAAFGTPTVVHFSLSLVLSAVLCVPWHNDAGLRGALAVLGAGAVVYSAIVLRRALRQQGYVPVAEDWIWHVLLPGGAYVAVLLSAAFVAGSRGGALFAVAVATLLLLCVGIHNAWDTVIYLTLGALQQDAPSRPQQASSQNAASHNAASHNASSPSGASHNAASRTGSAARGKRRR